MKTRAEEKRNRPREADRTTKAHSNDVNAGDRGEIGAAERPRALVASAGPESTNAVREAACNTKQTIVSPTDAQQPHDARAADAGTANAG